MAQDQSLHTFYKGLSSSNHEQLSEPGTYRDIRNMRLINDGDNNYILKSDEGMFLSLSIPQATTSNNKFEIIGWDTLEDLTFNVSNNILLIVFLSSTINNGLGQIGTVLIDVKTGLSSYTPLYTHNKLNFSLLYLKK